MTPLTLAMRNELARDAELSALLGSTTKWPSWVFVDKPSVKLENTGKCLIVIQTYEPWADMNMHNTMDFPTVLIDVWADSTRNPDSSVRVADAGLKIDAIHKIVKSHFHTVNLSRSGGRTLQWGTQTQVATNTGVWVAGSKLIDGPRYGEIANLPGAEVASFRYGVNLIN